MKKLMLLAMVVLGLLVSGTAQAQLSTSDQRKMIKSIKSIAEWQMIKSIALQRGANHNGWKGISIIIDQHSLITCKYAKVGGKGMIGASYRIAGIGRSDVIIDENDAEMFIDTEYDAYGKVKSIKRISPATGNYFVAEMISLLREHGDISPIDYSKALIQAGRQSGRDEKGGY